MKGKGKGKGKSKVKMGGENSSSLRVANLGAAIKSEAPTFNFGLLKKGGEHITLNDLRDTQYELEAALISTIKRKNQLENKIQKLETCQAKNRKRSRSTDSVEKKNAEERLPKKIKESTGKAHGASTSCQIKSKFTQPPSADPYVEVPKMQKTDGPNRFWNYLESYCADITQETIKSLEEWIRDSKNIDKYLEIPKLGTHFASLWPVFDMTEEIKEGSKSVENPKGLFTDSAADRAEVERILKLGENECAASEADDQYACMADRLVYSLVEENLMTADEDSMTEICKDDVVPKTKTSLLEPPSTSKEDPLEKRLCMQFAEAGLLDVEDSETDDTDDEVCRELKRLQGALIPLNEYNLLQKRKLLALAKSEIAKQEVTKRLQEVDIKIMEMYRTIAAARSNNTMNKKLEDQAKRILRERKRIIEKLDSME